MITSEIFNILKNFQVNNYNEFEILGLVTTIQNKKVISFIENKKYIKDISKDISCVFIKEDLQEYLPDNLSVIICDNPKLAFYKFHNYLIENCIDYLRKKYKSTIGECTSISEKSIVSDFNVSIGNNVVIEENVIIRNNVKIGDNSIIRAGTIIGGEGFLFNRTSDNRITEGKHVGGVLIGKDVEIQYNSCIDKAVFPWDNTIIGDFTKIDNLVHVGHAAKIGKRCMLPANSAIGGYTIIGNDSWIGVGAAVSNNITIGDRARASIGAVVTKNIEREKTVSGNFAIDHSKFLKFIKEIR